MEFHGLEYKSEGILLEHRNASNSERAMSDLMDALLCGEIERLSKYDLIIIEKRITKDPRLVAEIAWGFKRTEK